MRMREVLVPFEHATVRAELAVPKRAPGIIVLAHGSGVTRAEPHNAFIARALQRAGFGTLLTDLLDDFETSDTHNVFDVHLQAGRLARVAHLVARANGREPLKIGYFGSGVGSGIVIAAAAQTPECVCAVVSHGGRPDTASEWIARLRTPTLFIGDSPGRAPDWTALAYSGCPAPKALVYVPRAELAAAEPEALDAVARHTIDWFSRHLKQTGRNIRNIPTPPAS